MSKKRAWLINVLVIISILFYGNCADDALWKYEKLLSEFISFGLETAHYVYSYRRAHRNGRPRTVSISESKFPFAALASSCLLLPLLQLFSSVPSRWTHGLSSFVIRFDWHRVWLTGHLMIFIFCGFLFRLACNLFGIFSCRFILLLGLVIFRTYLFRIFFISWIYLYLYLFLCLCLSSHWDHPPDRSNYYTCPSASDCQDCWYREGRSWWTLPYFDQYRHLSALGLFLSSIFSTLVSLLLFCRSSYGNFDIICVRRLFAL